MNKIKLFQLGQMNGVLAGEIAKGQNRSSFTDAGMFSIALYNACRLIQNNVRADENYFVGKTKDGTIVSEYKSAVALYNGMQLRVAEVLPAGTKNYSSDDMVPIMLCLFPKFMENEEFRDFFERGKTLFEKDITSLTNWSDSEKASLMETLATLTSNAVCRVCDNAMAESISKGSSIVTGLLQADTFSKPSSQQMTANQNVLHVYGRPQTFFVVENNTVSLSDTKEYYLTNRDYSDDEKKRMEGIPSWYVMPTFVVKMARKIKYTSNEIVPIRTALIESPAGLGKTEACKALSSLLNLPYSTTICNADSEIFDFLGQVFPVGSDKPVSVEAIGNELGVTLDDIELSPEDAYFTLTGVKKDKVNLIDVYATYTEKVLEFYSKNVSTDGFTYVESELVKACRYGWLHEIQEPKVIRRAGVLVGLNELLTKQGSINLPTGEVLRKHQNTVIVLTTNKDYAGCDSLNASVISRMSLFIKLDGLIKEELVERAYNVVGLDRKWLDKMAEVIVKGQEFLLDQDITDGVIGPRELYAWASSVKIMGQVEGEITYDLIVEEAKETIVNKVSQNDDDVEAFLEGPFKDVFGGLARL